MKNPKLLNPGPVTLTARVRGALLNEDLCHREVEFTELQNELRAGLKQVYPEAAQDYTAVILTGSGTAAVEMMVGSIVPRGGEALVIANGVYGERIAAILTAQGKKAHIANAEWTAPMNLAEAEQILAREAGISHILAVHHETTTGRLNDIAALAKLSHQYQKPLLLDTVSSFGGEFIDFANWNIAACAATANKCLHGVPGIAFVLVQRSILETGVSGATSLYLDLFRHYQEQERGSTPFTQSVQVCYALAEALREFSDSGGWPARHAHYQALTKQIRIGLNNQNVGLLLNDEGALSACLTAYVMPRGFNYQGLHDFLKTKGFVIYGGQGKFAQEIFRIAVMGDLHSNDIDRLLAALQQFWRN